MKILQDSASVYSQMDVNAIAVRILHKGDEASLGGVKTGQGKKWVEVTLSDGMKGFLPGDTRIFSMIQATLNQPKTVLYATPSRDMPRGELKKGSIVNFLNMVVEGDQQWIQILDATGAQSYIEGKTPIIQKPIVTRQTGLRNMLIGGAFFVVGTIVTIGTYSSASSGGTYYICWGAIIFGAIQFLQGLFQFATAQQ
ncbi:MAG: hypothetical protein HY258_02170 [Chloroflexi bacterium]|nr:hypothetical protein [Chloroflexota bacterium]